MDQWLGDIIWSFGDFYDQLTDVICYLLSLNYYIYTLNIFDYPLLITTYFMFLFGLLKHVGCQEKIFNNNLKDKKKISIIFSNVICRRRKRNAF